MIGSLQAEHKLWVDRQYPNQPSAVPAYGMIEEAGELLHALLKLKQLELWGKDDRYTVEALNAKVVDAIGDCLIYMCSYLNSSEGIAFGFSAICHLAYSNFYVLRPYKAPLEAAAAAVSVSASRAPAPAIMDVTIYATAVIGAASLSGIDWEEALLSTWRVVKGRIRDGSQGKDSSSQEGSRLVQGCDVPEDYARAAARSVVGP